MIAPVWNLASSTVSHKTIDRLNKLINFWTFNQVKELDTCIRLLSLTDTVNEFDFILRCLFSF